MSEYDEYTLEQRNAYRSFKELIVDRYMDNRELTEFHKAIHDTWGFFIDRSTMRATTERGHLLGQLRIDSVMVNVAGAAVHYITVIAVNGHVYTGKWLPRDKDWKTNYALLDMLPEDIREYG